MRGHYEQSKLSISQPFIEAQLAAQAVPALSHRIDGRGEFLTKAGFAKLSEYFLPAPRSFADTQAELPGQAPLPSVSDAAIFHLVGPLFVEVEYSVEPEVDGPFNIYAEVSPLLVRLILHEGGQARILSVHGWEAAPDGLRSVVVHPEAADLGWDDDAILEAVKERFQASQRE